MAVGTDIQFNTKDGAADAWNKRTVVKEAK